MDVNGGICRQKQKINEKKYPLLVQKILVQFTAQYSI